MIIGYGKEGNNINNSSILKVSFWEKSVAPNDFGKSEDYLIYETKLKDKLNCLVIQENYFGNNFIE